MAKSNSILSVIMSNYNHSRYIGEALQAILSQSYRPMEVIVVDDASTDNSVEVIQKFADRDTIIHFIRNKKNMGAIYDIHKLLKLAKGDYIYAAAADDWILPGFFEKAMNVALQYPQAGIIFGQMLIFNAEGGGIGFEEVPNWKETKYVSPTTFLREYWDRISFSSQERKEAVARIQGISMGELEQWRQDTRRKLGVNVVS